jgi:hypothetical protein
VKQFAEQHLKDKKYRGIYRKLEAHRRLNRKIMRAYKSGVISEPVYDKVINAVENVDESLSEEQEKQIMETMKEKWASYEKLAHDVRLLETKVRHGTPLSGKCQLCRD